MGVSGVDVVLHDKSHEITLSINSWRYQHLDKWQLSKLEQVGGPRLLSLPCVATFYPLHIWAVASVIRQSLVVWDAAGPANYKTGNEYELLSESPSRRGGWTGMCRHLDNHSGRRSRVYLSDVRRRMTRGVSPEIGR